MPQTWEFANVGADCTPEIVLKATNPITSGEKVLLFQVLNGCFGRPVILSGTSANGQASEMIIGFGDATGGQLLDIDKNYDSLSIAPEWNIYDRVSGYIPTYYNYDDGYTRSRDYFRVASLRKRLFFNVNKYDLIKDFSPQVLIEKYTHNKGYGNRKNKTKAGFKRSTLISSIPLTGQITEMNFKQEEFFRLIDKGGTIKAKGYKKSRKTVHTYLQFRIQMTINGNTYITNPLLFLKLEAIYHSDAGAVRRSKEKKPINPLDDGPAEIDTIGGVVIIGYRLT